MSLALVALMLCSGGRQARGQATSASDTISSRPGFLGTAYLRGDRSISKSELERILFASRDPHMKPLIMSERSYSTLAFIPAFLGGFCVGYGLFTKPANPTLVLSGLVSIVGAAIIQNEAAFKLTEAIDRYNDSVRGNTSYVPVGPPGSTLRIGLTTTF
jgi:hypothetical protein